MKGRPILMSGPMVRAILEGRKTQTRRIVKPQPAEFCSDENNSAAGHLGEYLEEISCPYGKPGDRLWVKETWGYRGSSWSSNSPTVERHFLHFAADDARVSIEKPNGFGDSAACKFPKQRRQQKNEDEYAYNEYLTRYWRQWRPSIFMQRWMSRITLEIVNVRVERLNEISEEDAVAEGVAIDKGHAYVVAGHEHFAHRTAVGCMETLWGTLNGPGSWQANPWVWVVEFKRIEGGAR